MSAELSADEMQTMGEDRDRLAAPAASRRDVIKAGAAAGLAGLVASSGVAEAAEWGSSPLSLGETRSPRVARLGTAWRDPLLRLARRVTYGLTPELVAEVRAKGAPRFIEEQLNWVAIDDEDCESHVRAEYPSVFFTPQQFMQYGDTWPPTLALQAATTHRMVHSKRQLYWRMVEFWLDHFNVFIPKIDLPMYQLFARTAIERHALGNFQNLLRAVAHTGAMLFYLDQHESQGEHPNVNFARELMELHTIGVNGGQTQADIKAVAQAFTGWTAERSGPLAGRFRYEEWRHWPGDKRVLGRSVPFSGKTEGDQVLRILFDHPNCSRFIAWKLCRWFLDYEPSEWLVEDVANTFRRTRGDIRATLRVLLTAENAAAALPKLKRPNHLVASALRATGCWAIDDIFTLRQFHLQPMGHLIGNWEPADGYPDRAEYWTGNMSNRVRFALNLANHRIWAVRTSVEQRIGALRDPARLVAALNRELFGGEMTADEQANVRRFLAAVPVNPDRIRAAIGLCLASHDFQWY